MDIYLTIPTKFRKLCEQTLSQLSAFKETILFVQFVSDLFSLSEYLRIS